jgi:hypothetical protein
MPPHPESYVKLFLCLASLAQNSEVLLSLNNWGLEIKNKNTFQNVSQQNYILFNTLSNVSFL